MRIDTDFLRMHLQYTFWASGRVLDSLRSLPAGELERDCGNSHGGIFQTLLHIFYADRIWLSRTTTVPRATLFDPDETWTPDTLASAWASVAGEWLEWASGIDDAHAVLHYRNLSGQANAVELWEMVMHVVNHATYHRGQVTTMLRQCGREPVPTDFHLYRLSLR